MEQLLDTEGEEDLGELEPEKGKGKGRRKTSEVIVRESLARNYVFFGEEGMKKIRGSFVVVVGLGGVGVRSVLGGNEDEADRVADAECGSDDAGAEWGTEDPLD